MMKPNHASGLKSVPIAILAMFLAVAMPTVVIGAELDADIYSQVLVEQLEYGVQDGRDNVAWGAEAWIGGDYNKLRVTTEGEKIIGSAVESAEVQVLYSRLISRFFDANFGARYDIEPDSERGFAVIGVQGLAPLFIEVNAAAFISNEGEVSARFEAEYDVLLTQKLILQPLVEVNISGETIADRGIGVGVNDIELGLRLRYEFAREFAPYIGINWEQKFGKTADLAEEEGEAVDSLSFLVGVRFWF